MNFKNRISFHFMIAFTIIMAFVFSFVYFSVKKTVYSSLDQDLTFEANKHLSEVHIKNDSIQFINKAEWEEREHKETQINPVFIQLMNKNGGVIDTSPNLKLDVLPFYNDTALFFNSQLSGRAIRQIQYPIKINEGVEGYLIAAISSESAKSILLKLRNILFLSFFVMLGCTYFVSNFLAGRSIKPVQVMTDTINRITKNNLNERVQLPQHKDELYDLAFDFNNLIQRIEDAIQRERQFTSDASHELRTPLASLRGTLEVLIRKPRTTPEYEEKVGYSLGEIDKMTSTIEQLLLLARMDNQLSISDDHEVSLSTLLDETLARYHPSISHKNLRVRIDKTFDEDTLVSAYYSQLIIDNLISNAVKYSKKGTTIQICVYKSSAGVHCSIADEGIGIKNDDLTKLFGNFFRSEALNHKNITGNGLGLSIAKKAADALGAKITVASELNIGTKFTITF